jgi:hypothetical protein
MLHGGREKRGREPKAIWKRKQPWLECVFCFVGSCVGFEDAIA